jgi:hypothetical protein
MGALNAWSYWPKDRKEKISENILRGKGNQAGSRPCGYQAAIPEPDRIWPILFFKKFLDD